MAKPGPPDCYYCSRPSRLTNGKEVYPHRRDLWLLPFYVCTPCDARVGCHPGTEIALGRLGNAESRALKLAAHNAFDPLWKSGKMARGKAYAWLREQTGFDAQDCHMGVMSDEQLQQVIDICNKFRGVQDGKAGTQPPLL